MNKGKATARQTKRVEKRVAPETAQSQPKKKKKTGAKKTKGKKAAAAPPEEVKRYRDTTDPAEVNRLPGGIVHGNLKGAWTVDKGNPMWFIFDLHSPARHFKRGVRSLPGRDFPGYSKPPYEDLTETDDREDDDEPGWIQFAPFVVKYVDDFFWSLNLLDDAMRSNPASAKNTSSSARSRLNSSCHGRPTS